MDLRNGHRKTNSKFRLFFIVKKCQTLGFSFLEGIFCCGDRRNDPVVVEGSSRKVTGKWN